MINQNENHVSEISNSAIAILQYGKKLGARPWNISVDDLIWPLGLPLRLKGKRLIDLSSNDHLIIYPSKKILLLPYVGIRAKISVMISEPKILHGKNLLWLKYTYKRFHYVLTVYDDMINIIPNAKHFPFGSTWIPEWKYVDITKYKDMSIIVSEKRYFPGHILRHDLVRWLQNMEVNIDVVGRGYRPFEHKWEGLAPYYFSIIIENSLEKSYFTEKLIDAILCETVPIYLGCTNIDNYFDTKGMVICKNIDDVKTAVMLATKQLYIEKLPYLKAIRQKAAWYAAYDKRAAHIVLGIEDTFNCKTSTNMS